MTLPPAKQLVFQEKIKKIMTSNDLIILAKKIFVGFLIYIVPLLIIGGGLWLIQMVSSK